MLASLRRTWSRCTCAFTVGALLALSAGAFAPDLAVGAPLQRSDILASGSAGLQEYSPTGQLVQTIPGAAIECTDPNGRYLIAPGVGLFDSSGRPLPSNWASVPSSRCVADGYGDVYVPSADHTVAKYGIHGNLVQTFTLDPFAFAMAPFAVDLAPDECTLYYNAPYGLGRFNLCTNRLEAPFASLELADDVRVLPDWQVAAVTDHIGVLLDADGNFRQSYLPPFGTDTLRNESLDPDGTSIWICCAGGVLRYDISSGQLLAQWPASLTAVYGPPLLGNADVAPYVHSTPSGTAEAFRTRAQYSGALNRLHLWVDKATTVSGIVVGIYSDRFGRPGTLEEQGTILNVRSGSWNYADLPSSQVTAGQHYWIAVLALGHGTVAVHDRPFSGLRISSARHDLSALPARWSGGRLTLAGSLSAYGS